MATVPWKEGHASPPKKLFLGLGMEVKLDEQV